MCLFISLFNYSLIYSSIYTFIDSFLCSNSYLLFFFNFRVYRLKLCTKNLPISTQLSTNNKNYDVSARSVKS